MKPERVALVTGAATGIGRAIAWQLAEQGIAIAVNYSRSDKLAEETARGVRDRGAQVLLCRCDVSNEAGVRTMVANIEAELGGIDYLVNNAGTTYFVTADDLEGMSSEKWDRIHEVNVKGPFFCFRECVPRMKRRGSGAVVNISSVAALTGMGSSIAYAASKAALLSLTKAWAKTFAPEIRVNAVCPGVVTTRWLDDHQAMIESGIKETPMGRVSSPDDVADAVHFYLTGTDFITGQWLTVDGGRAIF